MTMMNAMNCISIDSDVNENVHNEMNSIDDDLLNKTMKNVDDENLIFVRKAIDHFDFDGFDDREMFAMIRQVFDKIFVLVMLNDDDSTSKKFSVFHFFSNWNFEIFRRLFVLSDWSPMLYYLKSISMLFSSMNDDFRLFRRIFVANETNQLDLEKYSNVWTMNFLLSIDLIEKFSLSMLTVDCDDVEMMFDDYLHHVDLICFCFYFRRFSNDDDVVRIDLSICFDFSSLFSYSSMMWLRSPSSSSLFRRRDNCDDRLNCRQLNLI